MPDSNITKRALASALKALLECEPFEKISVSAICAACGMNRKSFYYHFRDKYELVEWIYDTEFIEVMRSEDAQVDWRFVERLCTYFERNRLFYAKTLAYEGQNSFTSYFHAIVNELLRGIIDEYPPDSPIRQPAIAGFAVTFFADALTTSIKRWIMEGCPQHPHDFVRLLQLCIYGVPRLYQELKERQSLETLAGTALGVASDEDGKPSSSNASGLGNI